MRMFFAGVDNSTVFVFAGLDNSTAFVFAGLDNTTVFGWVFPKLFLPLSLSISQDICPACVSLIISHFRSHSIFYLIIIPHTIPLSLLLAQVSQTEMKCMHMCIETRQWIWCRPSYCIRRVTAEMELFISSFKF